MTTLYYLNKNKQMGVMKVVNINEPVLIPEDLIFCNVRFGVKFEKEPSDCIEFTDIERLIINSEFTDMDLLKESDFRKQNTYLDIRCQVDFDQPYYGDLSGFNFGLSVVSDEGDERIRFHGFGGKLPLNKLKIAFYLDGVEHLTETLNYYLIERPEFSGYQVLMLMEDGFYSFAYFRIPVLQDETGETKRFEYCKLLNTQTGQYSNEMSLTAVIPCAKITGILNDYLSFEMRPELIANPKPLNVVVKRNANIHSSTSIMSNDVNIHVGGYPQSGDAIFIYDEELTWANSNYYVVP
ncbi:hypothetical protein [Flavobacterium hibisci]|uniref:hypothetical protein n=1 Tax=Flavobacterium hibisci TaxID=1914462 RepID=UPI001CBBE643|nr:hypothetical protein [Flavobacterium hibisci]MBZ4040983.1 hypothetical protein [Flavobacterium hibisci]